jgi:hypothetical protein
MAKQQLAYRVYITSKGEQRMEEARCLLTDKRVAVSQRIGASSWSSATYYEPRNWPQGDWAWTVREAWEKFLAGKQKELAEAHETVAWATEHIALAQRALETWPKEELDREPV